jgi:hypothetical protein
LDPDKEVGTTQPPKGSKEEGLGEPCDRTKENGRICPRILPLSIISTVPLAPMSEFELNPHRRMTVWSFHPLRSGALARSPVE